MKNRIRSGRFLCLSALIVFFNVLLASPAMSIPQSECPSGPCCCSGFFCPSGSQPAGYTDYYFCSGTEGPTTTSYVNFRDYYCNGTDGAMHSSDSTVATCGTCDYCGAGNSSCSYYADGTACGTGTDCDGAGNCVLRRIDIGLRIYDGSSIITIAVEPLGTLTSPLRIAKGGNIYGVVLVDTSHPYASKIRVNTSSGVKALRIYS